MRPMMHRQHVRDPLAGAEPHVGGSAPVAPELPSESVLPPLTGVAELFHQLNNQLGIILANAELLELKARDDTSRARAAQVVSSVLEALTTARALRQQLDE
jgi:hypothetical protein